MSKLVRSLMNYCGFLANEFTHFPYRPSSFHSFSCEVLFYLSISYQILSHSTIKITHISFHPKSNINGLFLSLDMTQKQPHNIYNTEVTLDNK